MNVLVINCGSSSLKYQLINMDNEKVIAKGTYERIGEKSFLTHKINGNKYVLQHPVKNHKEALDFAIKQLLNNDYPAIKDLSEISAVGHRVAQGKDYFTGPVLINEDVIKKIEECSRACQELMPNIKMCAVFDTAFHQTIPEERYMYPIPYKYYQKYGIRKYGAHGTSHYYVSRRIAEILGKDVKDLKIVNCHLGQGASICAIQGGKSVETSMGLTPLGGIPMCSRSGDLDPSMVTFLMKNEGLTSDEKALDYYKYRIAQYIAQYAVSMQGIDVITFTAGVGENQIRVRKGIIDYLAYMGVKLDDERNNIRSEEAMISSDDSTIQVWVVPTNEELVIAKQTLEVINK